ncbi:hypothetical protein BGX38DRAFT_1139325 [Terfezia claveryi]|nr:hypothetical protein BGX38DRAFT_1139325 [Terfezia claveryi]
MPATEIEFSTPVLAYQAIRRKLLSLRRRKPTADDNETVTERQSKRKREFAPPDVIKRLNGDDNIRKVAVVASVQVGENGTAVFLMPLHGKASESLTSLLEMFHTAHATKKPVADGPLTSATANVTLHAGGVVVVGHGPTAVPDASSLQGGEVVASSYSSDSSSATVEALEHDPDRSDVFGQFDFKTTYRPKERVTSVSSEMSVATSTTVIWVGSLTPAPGQAGPSRMEVQAQRPPSEITVDWEDTPADEHEEEELAEGGPSSLSISSGSPKTMHVKTPGQSGMPSPNVEIYSTDNTPGEPDLNQFHPTPMPVEGKKLETIPDGTESHEKQVASEEGDKKQERPVVPFFYGSKIPVMAGKLSTATGNKNTYGSLIAHQRHTSGSDVCNPNTKPKPHSCAATPLAAPKPRRLRRSLTTPARILTRKDASAGHFPGTPPKSTGSTTPTSGGSPRPRSNSTSGGSPRPRSSSKIPIPIPSPTTPIAIVEGRTLNNIPPFGESFLGDIAEADCENEAIWERRRDDVMGPLGISPTTRLGCFVRPASLARISRAATISGRGISRAGTMPMGSLVGTAMASNAVTKS